MTVALTTAQQLPTAATASPLAGLTSRVKKLDPNELVAVANQITVEQQAAALAAQRAAAQEQLAALEAQKQAAVAAMAQTQSTARAAATERAPTTLAQTSTVPATSTATTGSSAVAIPASSIAPRTAHDYWNKHIAQFAGKYLADGPTMLPNCGPASATMALRMIGLDIPGFSGQNSEKVLDQARILATGKNDTSVGTTDTELETLITKSGAQWSESNDFSQITQWVKQGIPVVLSGNPSKGWDSRYDNKDVQHFDGGHWVTVSGYDQKTGFYIVNDPLSQIGPIYVSEQELQNYNSAHGKLGIAVFKDASQQQAA
ncbi:MAG: C39 family peptidase [Thermoleophilia bacterium]|nr:C39 family peptidase [Thermoleophilia bacterium]